MRRMLCAPTLAALLVLLGCATTTLKSTWKNPEITGPLQFKKVLLLAICKDPDRRAQVEGLLGVIMKRAEGIPSYIAIPDSALGDVQKIKSIMSENGFDGAVTVRLVNARQETTWVSSTYPSFWGYYQWAYPLAWDPGYKVTDTIIRLETKVYSLKDDCLVWSGVSDTFDPASLDGMVREVAAAVAADLEKRGLVN